MHARVAARTALCTAAVVATLATFGALVHPLVRSGFPAGHDAPAHLTYAYLFNRALDEGQFPVRWVDGVRSGESQPLFNFYQPGLYYLIELTHLLVPSLALSLKITVIIAWALGATFMYLLFKKLGRLPGVLAASLFACSPYILLDVFVRAAYPELVRHSNRPGTAVGARSGDRRLMPFSRCNRRVAHRTSAAVPSADLSRFQSALRCSGRYRVHEP